MYYRTPTGLRPLGGALDLRTLLAVEETTDFLADLLTDGLLQADPTYHRPHVRDFIRQEIGMAVTDCQTAILELPECVADGDGMGV